MPISLILTPFDHFHFRPTSGLLSSQDLTYCLTENSVQHCLITMISTDDHYHDRVGAGAIKLEVPVDLAMCWFKPLCSYQSAAS